jgi:ribosomal protein S11
MHDYAWLDDFGRGSDVAKRVLGNIKRLITRIKHLKPVSFDDTPRPEKR